MAALAGLALSTVTLLAELPLTRPAVAELIIGVVSRRIAGRLELDGISMLPDGRLELHGLRLFDPDGHLVLSVGSALVMADLRALGNRRVGVTLELDRPSVLLEEEKDGGTSIARAFAPRGRQAEGPARPAEPPRWRPDGFTVRVSRLELRGGDFWWVDAAGGTRAEATRVDVTARGIFAPDRSRAEVKLRGDLAAPLDTPVSLDLVATLSGSALRVPLLRVDAGGTALSLAGEGDLWRRTGRLAITRLDVSREEARALVPDVPAGADLVAAGYVESDGRVAAAALRLEPADGRRAGRAEGALATRLDAVGRSGGLDLAIDRLDPSLVSARWPAGEVTLTARGAFALRDQPRGQLALALSRSRLGRAEIGRANVLVRAGRDEVELERLSLAAPGLAIDGAGRWRRGGPVAGTVTLDASDVAAAARNAAVLAGVAPPPASGRLRVDATLSGTSAVPVVDAKIAAPTLSWRALAAEGVRVAARVAGPIAAPTGTLDGWIATLREGGEERASRVALQASLAGPDGSLSVNGRVRGGKDPVSLEASGRIDRDRATLALSRLELSYPGSRWTLARPATLNLREPSVDRLELADLSQRIVLEGGRGARGALDGRVEVSRLDLARLPSWILGVADARGEVSGHLEVAGAAARPLVTGQIALAQGALRGISGVRALVDGRLDGADRRFHATVSIARDAGGTLDAELDVPVPLAGRGAEPVRVHARGAALPLAELLATFESELPAAGLLGLELSVGGTASAPTLSGEVTVGDGSWGELGGIGLAVSFEAPGATARLVGSGSLDGRRVATAELSVPLDLGELAAAPARTRSALRSAPWHATAVVSALDLAALAGKVGLPRGLEGMVGAQAELTGSAAAPRGRVTVDVAAGAYGGWKGVGLHLDGTAASSGLSLAARAQLEGEEALRLQATLGLPPERLVERAALRGAPLSVEAVVPRIALGPAAGSVAPLAGTVDGRLAVSGTPGVPVLSATLAGSGVSIERRPLGDASVLLSYARGRSEAEVTLRPSAGGTLRGTLAVDAELGLDAAGPPLRAAPARATAAATGLDLAFVAALMPGLVRSAAGKLDLDVRASGPLARLSPRGTLHVAAGRLAVAELGEWTDIAVDARVTDDVFEVSKLEVRRGKGRLSASGALSGLAGDAAKLKARLSASSFSLVRAGMDFATVTVEATATGTYRAGTLDVEASVSRGVVGLPKKSPRALQATEQRTDIVVGRPVQKKPEVEAALARKEREHPLVLRAHLVAPRNVFVKGDDPKVDVELKADVRYEQAGEEGTYLSGTVESVRGTVEPIPARNFTIDKAAVQFSGGPPSAALLDISARYVNPGATVTVKVSGTLRRPELKLSSEPPMDESQIAFLIATGRTDLKAGRGGVGGSIFGGGVDSAMTGEAAGRAALGAVATQAFRNLVQNKLPLDTVALESTGFHAGKYVTDKIYVGYVWRWDADATKSENADEVQVDYQITPRWMFESRYGNAQAGGASLIWSKDY
jgi:translocation and assembly module TamB